MVHILIEHDVEEFKRWKTRFDEHAQARADAGSRGGRLLQGSEDTTHVVVLLDWRSLEEARAFANSDDLARAMDEAGVVGEPEITYLESVETFDR